MGWLPRPVIGFHQSSLGKRDVVEVRVMRNAEFEARRWAGISSATGTPLRMMTIFSPSSPSRGAGRTGFSRLNIQRSDGT